MAEHMPTTPGSAWENLGACRGIDTSLFFPGRGESVAEAKAVCAGCVVRVECADFALSTNQRFGIWGGTTERERRRIKAQLREVAAA